MSFCENVTLRNFLAIRYTYVYVAGIDVVTLTVIVTRNRSQGYTVVIICIKKGNINQSNHSV